MWVFSMKHLNSCLTSGDPIVCGRSIGQFPMFKNCGRGGRHPHEAVCHCPLNQRDGRTTGEGGREGGREASHAHSHGGRQPRGHCRRDGERGEGGTEDRRYCQESSIRFDGPNNDDNLASNTAKGLKRDLHKVKSTKKFRVIAIDNCQSVARWFSSSLLCSLAVQRRK